MKLAGTCLTCGLLLTLLTAGAAAAQQPSSCDSAEHRQFDFWLGAWEVVTPDGQLAGHNTIQSVLNGCALEESWRGVTGSRGKSFNMYYARDGRWHQSWVDGAGGRLDLAGGLDSSGRMVLAGTMPGADDGEVLHEISWEDLGDGTVKQHWRASRNGGEGWQDVFVGIYRPAERSTSSADGRD
ncbi:MAG: hypothetical protein ACE5EG_03160 [Thermoanaerobaculia bacterium]